MVHFINIRSLLFSTVEDKKNKKIKIKQQQQQQKT